MGLREDARVALIAWNTEHEGQSDDLEDAKRADVISDIWEPRVKFLEARINMARQWVIERRSSMTKGEMAAFLPIFDVGQESNTQSIEMDRLDLLQNSDLIVIMWGGGPEQGWVAQGLVEYGLAVALGKDVILIAHPDLGEPPKPMRDYCYGMVSSEAEAEQVTLRWLRERGRA